MDGDGGWLEATTNVDSSDVHLASMPKVLKVLELLGPRRLVKGVLLYDRLVELKLEEEIGGSELVFAGEPFCRVSG